MLRVYLEFASLFMFICILFNFATCIKAENIKARKRVHSQKEKSYWLAKVKTRCTNRSEVGGSLFVIVADWRCFIIYVLQLYSGSIVNYVTDVCWKHKSRLSATELKNASDDQRKNVNCFLCSIDMPAHLVWFHCSSRQEKFSLYQQQSFFKEVRQRNEKEL